MFDAKQHKLINKNKNLDQTNHAPLFISSDNNGNNQRFENQKTEF